MGQQLYGREVEAVPWAGKLAAALTGLNRAAAIGADIVELLASLAQSCVDILPVAAAGLLVLDQTGNLMVIGSSSDAAELLDLFQLQNEEGPCLDCCRTGEAVSIDQLDERSSRWPRFAGAARAEGFSAVYAIPLSSLGVVVGALNLFARTPLNEQALQSAQAMADAATFALLRIDPVIDAAVVARQLYQAIESRNVIEQAKGMLAQRFEEDPIAALDRLQQAAARADVGMVEMARLVVTRQAVVEEGGSLRA